MKTFLLRILVLTCCFTFAFAQEVEPGVERWAVKTKVPSSPRKKKASLQALLDLHDPIASRSEAADTRRISQSVDGFKEGDLVTTKGYIHLIATERDSKRHRDGDYHIQMRTTGQWGDTCFVIEVPYPDFIENVELRAKCERVRSFIRDSLLRGREPGTRGNIMQHEVYVTVTGQLFFDAAHMGGSPRGKRGDGPGPMRSYTCWELHPVTAIAFAPKPH